LAAEVEAWHEQVAHVLGAVDLARGKLVERRRRRLELAERFGEPGEVGAEALVAVLREQLHEQFRVDPRRVEMVDRLAVALLPVREEIGVERARPADAALEQAEAELRKAPRDTAEEQRLAGRLHAGAE